MKTGTALDIRLGSQGLTFLLALGFLSVVDCFDALTSDRPYRPRLGFEAATKILLDRRSSMYDPLVVDAFIRLQPVLVSKTEADSTAAVTLQLDRIAHSAEPRHLAVISRDGDEISLFRVYQILADATDRPWQDTADLVLHRLGSVIPFEAAVVLVYDAASDELVCETVHGTALMAQRGRRLRVGQGLTGWVAAHKKTVLNSPGALDSDDDQAAVLKEVLEQHEHPDHERRYSGRSGDHVRACP